MRILFITRKYPPSIGGMQKVSYELIQNMSKITETHTITWGRSQAFLPFFLTYAFFESLWIVYRKNIEIIHLCDGLLAPLGVVIKSLTNKPVTVTIHGLDITFKNRVYQFLIPRYIKKLDKIICISNATKEECIKRDIPTEKIVIIPNGISDEYYLNKDKTQLRKKLENKIKIDLKNKKILLSVGRLVERKGFHWFIENAMPKLLEERNDIIYLIAGDGPLKGKLKNIIEKNSLENYVFLLGKVNNETLKLLYNSSDVFVMPNIPVEGDMEGFGIVGLEVNSCGIPTIASNIEGMKDFVKNGINGYIVEPKNYNGFIKKIKRSVKFSSKMKFYIRKYTLRNFSWEKLGKKYLNEIKNVSVYEKNNY